LLLLRGRDATRGVLTLLNDGIDGALTLMLDLRAFSGVVVGWEGMGCQTSLMIWGHARQRSTHWTVLIMTGAMSHPTVGGLISTRNNVTREKSMVRQDIQELVTVKISQSGRLQ